MASLGYAGAVRGFRFLDGSDGLPQDAGPHMGMATPLTRYPPADTVGASHVEEALRDIPFPLTAEDLLARCGDWRIPVTGSRFVRLRELLQDVRKGRRFHDAHEVAKAVARRALPPGRE